MFNKIEKIGADLIRLNYILIGLNFIFWLGVAIFYSFRFKGQNEYTAIRVLLFLEPACFALIFYGMWKHIKTIFYLSFPFLILNSILSLTDQFGLLDGVSLCLNFLLFLSLFGLRIKTPTTKK